MEGLVAQSHPHVQLLGIKQIYTHSSSNSDQQPSLFIAKWEVGTPWGK